LNSTTFVRVIFRYHLYLRSYLRGWIKMAHPVYPNSQAYTANCLQHASWQNFGSSRVWSAISISVDRNAAENEQPCVM